MKVFVTISNRYLKIVLVVGLNVLNNSVIWAEEELFD